MDIQRKTAVVPPARKKETTPVVPVFREPSFIAPERPPSWERPVQPEFQLRKEAIWQRPRPATPSLLERVRQPLVTVSKKRGTSFVTRPRFFRGNLSDLKKAIQVGTVSLMLLGIVFCGYGFFMKGAIERSLQGGIEYTEQGIDALGARDFEKAEQSFVAAEASFKKTRRQMLYFPAWLAKPLTVIPGISKIGSGVLAADASMHLARGTQEATNVLERFLASRERVAEGEPVSYLLLLEESEGSLAVIQEEFAQADASLRAIPKRDIPEEHRMTFEVLQSGVPGIAEGIGSLLANKPLLEELLGKNGPRTYLFLFQNNQELRPTGGFIGTYGILEFKNGHARRFFIDGIFNPDGQLKENIIPPKPIQKISAGWSLHDSNWFPDFPTSAEKAIFFYEKTGGPTVDGVFTLTPTVLERLLALTGPIELPEYSMVVDSKNFIPTIQEQVEIKYDKVENKPKKVLSDLSSILMERVFSLTDPLELYQVANIFVEGLNERHILLYTRTPETEALIETNGWSGKIDDTPRDYLSVVNTNVNGYKTDGVINDTVEHRVTIDEDGTALAVTTVTREHTGGNTPYDWWNRVNSNYMRVYVPKGSKLINAVGHTREFPPAPLDYKLLGFKEDPDVQKEESVITIDEKSGTRVGEEFGKTVFGNWVYVSPGETVRVEYTYLLPFRIHPDELHNAGYSLLFQKQPGMKTVALKTSLAYPKDWDIYWASEDNLQPLGESDIHVERAAQHDVFWGVIFDN